MKRILSFALALIMVLSIFSAVSFAASAPAKVTGVKVTSVTADSAKVSWKAVSKASGYVIYKYIKSSNKYVKLATVTGTAKTIKNLKEETKYTVCVSAYKKASGKTTIGKKSELVSFTTKSDSFATKKLFYNYLRKNFTLATSSGFPTETNSDSVFSAKIFDFDGDGKLEMVTFTVSKTPCELTVSYYEIKNGKVSLINKLKNICYTAGMGEWRIQQCSYLKGKKIFIENYLYDDLYGSNWYYIIIAVKNGKLKILKNYEAYIYRDTFLSENVSGKNFSSYSSFSSAVSKAGFKKHTPNEYNECNGHSHGFEKTSDISKGHLYAFSARENDSTSKCTLFVDKTNLKSHMK